MIYVSIDIETSGLDPLLHKTLSIGAIVEDTTKKLSWNEIPKFNAVIVQNEITGSPRALSMNKKIIEQIGVYLEGTSDERLKLAMSAQCDFYEKEDVIKEFYKFLWKNGFGEGEVPVIGSNTKPIAINVAGKNFGTFDKLFLQQLPWWQKIIRARQRVLDPAILFCDWKNDESLPSITVCKDRAGLHGLVTHDALEDAWDVVEVLRKFY